MTTIANSTNNPPKIEGRWKRFAAFSSEPGTTGTVVERAATGPPVKKYCITAQPPAAAAAAASGETSYFSTIVRNGNTIAADAAFD